MYRSALLVASLLLGTSSAAANGRMPGATEISVVEEPDHLVARATFGLVQTFDGGKHWSWICEQAIGVSGEADPPLTVTRGGVLILISPKGGVSISRDRACSWSPGPALLQGKRTVDLTRDPADGQRVLVVASSIGSIDDAGLVTYENRVVETRDGGAGWSELAPLPGDFSAETIEVAPSDPRRIYVSGTAAANPLLGVIVRSEDAGATWLRSELALPAGSGSVFVGAIHPNDPDRLWIRVPARNDVFGFFPATLLASADRGQTFGVVATTSRGMFGFALSPDGTRIAYGGPADGLYVGPASGPFSKVSSVGVRCLKWGQRGLYACGSQPPEAFTLGLSPNADRNFEPLYDARTTCPMECPASSGFDAACAATWAAIGPTMVGSTCGLPVSDAGGEAGGADAAPDAPIEAGDAAVTAPAPLVASGGCGCELPRSRPGLAPLWALLLLGAARRALRARASSC